MSAIQRPLKLPSKPARVQVENRALWNDGRSPENAEFFTLGYSGRTANEILCLLTNAGVRSLIDIRFSPVSMYRPELSKANLQRTVESSGMQYLHFPYLGVPRHIRAQAVEAGHRDVIWAWYDENVVKPFLEQKLHRFLNFADHPVALMCVEADPLDCHRHRLFQALEDHGLQGFDL